MAKVTVLIAVPLSIGTVHSQQRSRGSGRGRVNPLDEETWFGSDDGSHESGAVSQQIEVPHCIV
jgi:hypothetical protein